MSFNFKGVTMKSKISLSVLMFMLGTNLYADNNESFSGNLRLGYQYGKDDIGSGNEMAVGGYLHYESKDFNGISGGVRLSTTYGDKGGDGGYFIHGVSTNVALLSQAYIKAKNESSELKVGRQALETPFANSDDIGMIQNHFGGATFTNHSLKDTTLTAGFIRSMAIGCGDAQDRFEKLDDGVYMAGVNYEGVENLTFQAWHYDKLEDMRASYMDGVYSGELGNLGYVAGVQYSHQQFDNDSNNIYGTLLALNHKSSGVGIMTAFNKTDGIGADNLYGGGPFFTNAEHTTLADGGDKASAYKVGVNLDTQSIGIDNVTLSVEKLWVNKKDEGTISNFGIIGEYSYNDNLAFRAYYSDIKDDVDGDKQNLRVFADYSF
ncbi:MAG: OprD family porin [Sulfurovum sp.]|nr:MAG: OprD family porin [Sulfurovum sp.]